MSKVAAGAVAASTPIVAAFASQGEALISLALGLVGVLLSRMVFVDRQNAKLGRRQSLRETIPLTLVAMLIAGVVIIDRNFGFSAATFTGLGIGWTAIVLLDVIGKRILDPSSIVIQEAPNLLKPVPEDMVETTERIEQKALASPDSRGTRND